MTDETERKHMNHTITLLPSWEFKVTGPEFDEDRRGYKMTFQSFDAAREEIAKRVNDTARLAAQNTTLRLNLLDGEGNFCQVEKINRMTGDLIGIRGSNAYPNVQWIRAMLLEAKQIRSRLQEIQDKLHPLALSTSRSYSRIKIEDYAGHVDALVKQHDARLSLAKAEAEPKPLSVVPKESA